MKLIGIEEHFLTSEIRDAWRAIALDATDPSVAFHSGTIERRLLDLAQDRLALMDETGLDWMQLTLGNTYLTESHSTPTAMVRTVSGAPTLK